MQSEKLMLSWQEHHGALVSVFESLLQSNTLVDCTLAAEGQCIKAHKVVLSACSPYFQMMFREASEKHPIVFLKDVKFEEVKAIVDFMYRGEVEVSEDRLGRFFEIANSLQIKGLNNSRNTNQFEGRISHDSAEAHPNEMITTATSLPSKKSQKDHLLPSEHETNVSAKSVGEKTKVRDDEYIHRQEPLCAGDPCATKTVSIESTFSLASSSFPVASEGQDKQNNIKSASPPARFPGGDERFHSLPQTIKTEPENDSYQEQHSDFVNEREREDFEETSMMEDTNEWIEPRSDSIHNQQPTDQQCSSFLPVHVKVEDCSSGMLVDGRTAEQPTSQGAVSSDNIEELTTVLMKEGAWRFQMQQHCEDTTNSIDSECPFVTSHEAKVLQADLQRLSMSDKFRCKVCCKVLSSSYSLKTHMRIHTGERPYKCRLCDYASTVACNLRKHILVHTGERPYPCEVCGASFSQIGTLRYHQQLHKREQVYGCNECNKKFVSSCSLRAHKRRYHEFLHVVS